MNIRLFIRDVNGVIMGRVTDLLNSVNFTDVGYGWRWFRVWIPAGLTGTGKGVWDKVKVRGLFSLLPRDEVIFIAMWPKEYVDKKGRLVETEFDPYTYIDISRRAMENGWKPLPWKDTGMKSSDGKYRLLPFAKIDFNLAEWINKKFGIKFPESELIGKGAKYMKYFTQPVDWRRRAILKVLVVPNHLLNADGCGYSPYRIFGIKGAVKGMGLGKDKDGNGVVLKGMVETGVRLEYKVPAKVLDMIQKKGFALQEFDVLASDETVKNSRPWTIYEVEWFWHDDSTRNRKREVTIPEQVLRVAPELSDKYKEIIGQKLAAREDFLKKILEKDPKDRYKMIADWVNGIIEEADLDPTEDDGDELMLGEVAGLLKTGLPALFNSKATKPDHPKKIRENIESKSLLGKLAKGLASFIRRRAIGSIKVPGFMGFFITNNTLKPGTVALYRGDARRLGLKVGDIVTIYKLPVCARSIITFKIARLHNMPGVIETNEADAFNRDNDGDKGIGLPGSLTEDPNWAKVDKDLLAHYEEELEDILSDPIVSQELTPIEVVHSKDDKVNPYLAQLAMGFEVLEQSRLVGRFSSQRSAYEVGLYGEYKQEDRLEEWKIKTSLIFQMIEEGVLIKGKKHSVPIKVDISELIKFLNEWLAGSLEYGRPNWHRGLLSRPKYTNAQQIDQRVNGWKWAKSNGRWVKTEDDNGWSDFVASGHPLTWLYSKGLDIARLILDLFRFEDYMGAFKAFKGLWFPYLVRVVKWARDNGIKAAQYISNNGKYWAVGELGQRYTRMIQFYKSNPTTEQKEAFREEENAFFASLDATSRLVVLAWIINQEAYAWLYYFKPSEIRRLLVKSGWLDEPDPDDAPDPDRSPDGEDSGEDTSVEEVETPEDTSSGIENNKDDSDPEPGSKKDGPENNVTTGSGDSSNNGPVYEKGDMWSVLDHSDLFLITTNSFVKRNGELVMGRGIALEAKTRFPGLAQSFGETISNTCGHLGEYNIILPKPGSKIGAFQVKYFWGDQADLKLIERSVNALIKIAPNYTRIDINFPGIGNGRLKYDDVKAIVDRLPENVHVWTRS